MEHAPGNAKYTSRQIQNEIVLMCEEAIREKILKSIAKYWSIMADETQDCSTTEQVSLCICSVKGNVLLRMCGILISVLANVFSRLAFGEEILFHRP